MSSKLTQNKRILDYLDKNGSITPQEAMLNLGIMRLAARIMELRVAGHDIPCEMVAGKNAYGTFHYARYRRN